jgi:hypothetical protein
VREELEGLRGLWVDCGGVVAPLADPHKEETLVRETRTYIRAREHACSVL